MVRVRFAPSPTGYLHIGSARTFIFNWLFARKEKGAMILRIDDTDVERNTQASEDSIFDGLKWLELDWDEQYRQSERIPLHQKLANTIFERGFAYRDFTPATAASPEDKTTDGKPWLFNPGAREISAEESDRRAAAGEPFVIRFRVPREPVRDITFHDLVYGEQSKSSADIEDFALLRSNGMPTYHMASCADDADLNITHIIRGQDHLSNTFKHVLIFQALGHDVPAFAHLPLLVAPDGAKLSKRKHGPVVSVTTYRDAGFLPHSYVNFLCLLGWSPKDNREQMSREELVSTFSFDGVNRSNTVVNFTEADPIDPKALWLNSQHLRTMPIEDLAPRVKQWLEAKGVAIPNLGEEWFRYTVDVTRSRFVSFNDFNTRGLAYFSDDYEITPEAVAKLDPARELLREFAPRLAANPEFTEASVEADLRAFAAEKGVKPGLLINGSRAALTGQTVGPSVFHVFAAIGRDRTIARLSKV
jgi:glutamyl-tRNA synthetase